MRCCFAYGLSVVLGVSGEGDGGACGWTVLLGDVGVVCSYRYLWPSDPSLVEPASVEAGECGPCQAIHPSSFPSPPASSEVRRMSLCILAIVGAGRCGGARVRRWSRTEECFGLECRSHSNHSSTSTNSEEASFIAHATHTTTTLHPCPPLSYSLETQVHPQHSTHSLSSLCTCHTHSHQHRHSQPLAPCRHPSLLPVPPAAPPYTWSLILSGWYSPSPLVAPAAASVLAPSAVDLLFHHLCAVAGRGIGDGAPAERSLWYV